LINRSMVFAAFTWLAVIAASGSLNPISAQSSGNSAVARAQQAVRQQILSREGQRGSTVVFNNDTQSESDMNTSVRVSGSGTLSNNGNSRNSRGRGNNMDAREFIYEALVTNRGRNRGNAATVSGVRYEWRGNWSGRDRGNDGRFLGGDPPNGQVRYSGPIMNRHSDKALDVSAQSLQDGANIQQWGYAGQPNQNWDVIDLGNNEIAIISRHSGKALTVQGRRDSNGSNIIQRNWSGDTQQRWRMEQVGGDYYRIVSVDNGRCLDCTG
jgi:hypothetical protein